MTNRTQPDAREFTMSQYASKDSMIGAMRERIAELESELEAVNAGKVQALSAAPEAIAKLRHLYKNLMCNGVRSTEDAKRIAEGLLAPAIAALERATPPAEQQAAPKAAPGERRNTKTHDLLSTMIGLFLGHKQAIGYKPSSVIDKVVNEAVEHLKDWPYPEAAPQQEAQETTEVPYQKLTNEIDLILSDPDTELSIGAKRALLWMRTWVSVPLFTAPQQEAQEPVAWLVPTLQTFKGAERVHFTRAPGCTMTDAELIDHMEGRVVWIAKTFSDSPVITDKFGVEHKPKPLYTAPKPAPAELEQLRERISRMGLDVDRAMRGHVNEQSPLGTQRLAAIAALAKPAPAPLSRDQIREVFMAHGFTIKEGQTDLKQYVYDAAYALLGTKPAPLSDDAKDAARYRWLRATTNFATNSQGERIDVRNQPEKWDAAIDAALAAQGGKV